jgi:L-threonylcarbamoyladenylate synthase
MDPSNTQIAPSSAALRQGKLVVYPTETYYALGVNPGDAQAVQRLLLAKGRAADQGLPLIAADLAACQRAMHLPPVLLALAQQFWPGPLTLVAPAKRPGSWPQVQAADGTLAVRVSSHLQAAALAAAMPEGLLVSTSANRSGAPPATQVAQLQPELLQHVACVVQGGPLPGGAPSTLVGVDAAGEPRMLRLGVLSPAELGL